MLEQLEQLAARDEKRAARAAKKHGWKLERVPRETAKPSKRSSAARKGWEKRRAAEKARARKTVKTNPLEESAGEWAYVLYDDAHPLHGDASTKAKWDADLAPYYGKTIRLTLNGWRKNPKTNKTRRIFIRRIATLNAYSDFFGPGSMYAKALKVVRDIASDDELVISSLTIEEASEGDTDTETLGGHADESEEENDE
jgi:hypothetical protein